MRIELAQGWIGSDGPALEITDQSSAPVALWDVYQTTPAARIRGSDTYFGDLVASDVVHQASEYFESALPPEQTRLQFLRRHLPAFTRGFDSRYEGVVDLLALGSVARGRALSDSLRRFEKGGFYIGTVSDHLAELVSTINELHYANDNPVGFAIGQLSAIQETPLAECLVELFRDHSSLAEDIFQENAQYEFFSRTQIQTNSPFDLMRSALFHVTQGVQADQESDDEAEALMESARGSLKRLTGMARAGSVPKLLDAARLFEEGFDTLGRVLRGVLRPLQFARMLAKPPAVFQPDYIAELKRRGIGSAI